MRIVWWLFMLWFVGFLPTLVFNIMLAPVPPGVATTRALVWPYYFATGKPK